MNALTKSLLGAACLAMAVVAVFAARHRAPVVTPASATPQAQMQSSPATKTLPVETIPGQPKVLAVSSDEIVIPPLPADATSVPDADLLKLSEWVNIPNAEERHIDKERWSRALPIAQRLAQGPCDCEQRNWLVHFIQMGKHALAGSSDDYYRVAGLMRKMARNDKQLESDPAFFSR